jgi:hypothetical protein
MELLPAACDATFWRLMNLSQLAVSIDQADEVRVEVDEARIGSEVLVDAVHAKARAEACGVGREAGRAVAENAEARGA